MFPRTLVGRGGVVVAFVLHASLACADGPDVSLPPGRAVALALAAHPDLRSADAALATAEAARSQSAILLSNPTMSGWSTPDGSRADLGVAQPLSLTGEGWHARRGATLRIQSSEATQSRTARVLAAQVRSAYVDAVVASGVVEVAHDGTELASRLTFAVERKHDEGEASSLDVRLARLAEVQAATRLLEARRVESEALRRLSSLVLEPVDAADLARDPLLAVPTAPADGMAPRADVAAAEAALRAAEADLRRARSATLPPVAVGVGIQLEDGTTYVGPSLTIGLPLFDRNQTDRAQTSGAVEVAAGRLAEVRARAETERQTSELRVAEAESAAVVEGADLDEARSALRSVEAGVLAGEIDLPTAVLLQAQVLQGEAAVVTLRGQLADARIDRLLALDDDTLLGGAR